ncbi:hypothetical protein HD554DRAFT_2041982 [Boletus coccyginus]|nr:hypothetical protein HD554DRAFT_2041982 [Boletus coccyginus]
MNQGTNVHVTGCCRVGPDPKTAAFERMAQDRISAERQRETRAHCLGEGSVPGCDASLLPRYTGTRQHYHDNHDEQGHELVPIGKRATTVWRWQHDLHLITQAWAQKPSCARGSSRFETAPNPTHHSAVARAGVMRPRETVVAVFRLQETFGYESVWIMIEERGLRVAFGSGIYRCNQHRIYVQPSQDLRFFPGFVIGVGVDASGF